MGTPRTEYRDIGGPADPSPYSTPRPEYRDIAPAADDVPPSSTGFHLLGFQSGRISFQWFFLWELIDM